LYKKIGDIAQIDEQTIVLDVCCGTGTIGLTLAKVKYFENRIDYM
jgi:tRNA (uracil-5-)-methyltransferase